LPQFLPRAVQLNRIKAVIVCRCARCAHLQTSKYQASV